MLTISELKINFEAHEGSWYLLKSLSQVVSTVDKAGLYKSNGFTLQDSLCNHSDV